MMTLQMDKTTASSSRERAKSLFDKTVELENKRWKAVQDRNPFDPNLWQQIRENYEAILFEDHAFSEQHNIEIILWQLHYKRIENCRGHINAFLNSSSSSAANNVKGPSRLDQIAKLKLQFRTLLSEATGFYHDLISKIRSKYGLPLGYFSEDQASQNMADKDGKKLAEVKKGLVSCHRCLIYLGDLARYKGLYGEGDSKNREYAAASSYYLQAASLWPGSGNPHHQLAIIASYSSDEFALTYRYFRSLAVESPFPTARDNLIVAFEKNRQTYARLFVASKDTSKKPIGKGRGKGRGKGEDTSSKDANLVAGPEKDKVTSANDMLKAFCIRFVRLNGILFTRTSLETFLDVLTCSTTENLKPLSGLDSAFHENRFLQARGNASIQVPASIGSNLLGLLQASTQSQASHLQQVQTQAVNPQAAQSLAAARLQPMQSQVAQLQPLPSRVVHFQQTQAPLSHVSLVQSQSASLGGGTKWLPEEAASLASSQSSFAQIGNGHVMRNEVQGNHGVSYHPAHSLPVHQSYNVNGMGGMPSQSRTSEAVFPPKSETVSSSGVIADGLGVQSSIARKNPISRAFRHLGPPPGFNTVPSKLQKEPVPGSDLSGNNLAVDDYRWLDGYETQSSRGAGLNSSLNYASKSEQMGTSNGMNGAANFPFPGKQIPTSQVQADLPYFQNPQKDSFVNQNHQSAQLPEQYQGQSTWSSRHFV
ncbi:PREDICTED: LOW QUALITY PROTEIN: protein SMG7 [Camelina sativa]|uniref:LOW QUALITY PROTEIN: protein SMG7 n=1 Tax=Camelina sativa TaxID=90675 RepID=A0ABM1QUZ1_CAMSA|nr:PREDICTED: LOW QUALITY PROTEIN: protein SMG7 [Camelina sativa]